MKQSRTAETHRAHLVQTRCHADEVEPDEKKKKRKTREKMRAPQIGNGTHISR